VADPATAGAVYRPLLLTVPDPLAIDQVKPGWLASASPNALANASVSVHVV